MSALVELVGVAKNYGDTTALHPTDLSIERGKTTALIGPSGCGKSTLLRLIIGLVRPDAGEIIFEDEPITPDKLETFRRRVGYVIQEGGLFPHFTARGNILLMARHLARHHQIPTRELDGPSPSSLHSRLINFQARLQELCDLTRFPIGLLDR